MNRRKATDGADALDQRLLRSLGDATGPLQPSPAFTHATMAAVHAEAERAAALRPLSFPWRRAVPGLAAALAVFALCIALVLKSAVEQMPAAHAGPAAFTAVLGSLADAGRWRLGSLGMGLLLALTPLLCISSVMQGSRLEH